MRYTRKSKSVFQIFLILFMSVVLIQALLISMGFYFSGVNDRMNQNARDILDKQTENRKTYLENTMIDTWSNLTLLSHDINTATQRLVNSGAINIETLDSSSGACLPLLEEISPQLISAIYSNQTTGIYIIFNTHDLDTMEEDFARPGLYVRDLDPLSTPSIRNSDLLVERAPIQLVQTLKIPTDSGWSPMFMLDHTNKNSILYKPFQSAYLSEDRQNPLDFGYWTTDLFSLHGEQLEALHYSIPLILDDGTIYGVLGVELLSSYVQSLLPYEELMDDNQGTYLLGTISTVDEDTMSFHTTLRSAGPFFTGVAKDPTLTLHRQESGYFIEEEEYAYYISVHPLSLYSRNGPHSPDQWVLLGTARTDQLYSFSRQVRNMQITSVMTSLLIAVVFSILASKQFANPIARLSAQVISHSGKTEMPSFPKTGIREIDHFSSAITELSRQIEKERDYDSLTGLYSRRAFNRKGEELFQNPQQLKHTALLMIDLDNLKNINDAFGHGWGDRYIRQAAACMINNMPPRCICARVSGDEFFVLLYGYDNKESIRHILSRMTDAIRNETMNLPNGKSLHVSASGGIAWYPDDCQDLGTMMKYADFAMYQVKRSHKGESGDFDIQNYSENEFQIQSKKEFHAFLSHEIVEYYFQPIADAHTGKIVAYEALMRVNMPTLRSPEVIMKIAREENCLHEIERITIFKASEAFKRLLNLGVIQEDSLLFVNSIANQHLYPQEVDLYVNKFSDVQSRMVIEITELENLDLESLNAKRNSPGFSGLFALDDYGSGYNSEVNLLELAPRYIKVDMSIIRDIDKNKDKQGILENIVYYAHNRNMLIIAEGVETEAEARTAIQLGTDLLQGYFLARPSAIPSRIHPDALRLIQSLSSTDL